MVNHWNLINAFSIIHIKYTRAYCKTVIYNIYKNNDKNLKH